MGTSLKEVNWASVRPIRAKYSDTSIFSKILPTVEYYSGKLIARLEMQTSDTRLIREKATLYRRQMRELRDDENVSEFCHR